MAGLLVLTLLPLVLLVSTNATDLFQRCCPEDDEHIFLKKDKLCKASRYSVLTCEDDNVNFLSQSNSYYWFIENGGSVVITSEALGIVLVYDSFCVATIVDETSSENNKTVQQAEEGIIYCAAQPYATYLGPDPLSFAAHSLMSGIGCFLTFLVYILVPELQRDLLNKCLLNVLLCYTVMYLMQGVTAFRIHQLPQNFCSYQSLLTFFWITTSILWTYVISFEIWRSVVYNNLLFKEAHLLKIYYFWGWAMPVILSVVGLIINDSRVIDIIDDCHINPVYVFTLYAQPALVLLFLAMLYFIWTLCKHCNQDTPKIQDNQAIGFGTVHHNFRCYLHWKLLLVTSIPWMICVITAYLPGNLFTRIVVHILVALQGPLIFLFLVVLRKKALLGIAEMLVNCKLHCSLVMMNLASKLSDEDEISEVNNEEAEQLVIKVKDISEQGQH